MKWLLSIIQCAKNDEQALVLQECCRLSRLLAGYKLQIYSGNQLHCSQLHDRGSEISPPLLQSAAPAGRNHTGPSHWAQPLGVSPYRTRERIMLTVTLRAKAAPRFLLSNSATSTWLSPRSAPWKKICESWDCETEPGEKSRSRCMKRTEAKSPLLMGSQQKCLDRISARKTQKCLWISSRIGTSSYCSTVNKSTFVCSRITCSYFLLQSHAYVGLYYVKMWFVRTL